MDWRIALTLPALRASFPLPQGERNLGQDTVDIAHHIMVPEAQDVIALRFKIAGASRVLFGAFRMGCAIDFHDQVRAEAEKIRDIGTMWHLTTEFHGRQLFAQGRPQALFGVGGVAAKGAGAGDRA